MTTEEFKTELLPLKNKLFRLAWHLTGQREEAEDVVQEVYLKIWDMRHRLGKYKSVEGLLVTMTRNRSLDRLQRKKNKMLPLKPEIIHRSADDLQRQTEVSYLVQKVKKMMADLPEQQQTIMYLRDVEGYDFEEIAEITGFDGNYIRVNLSRARKKIRMEIEKIEKYGMGKR
ncbi:MAG: DNA-directed RNA polymerase sigma-70 factor [bacterium]|nr:MAG: DNA-directed RNA polymerase sigma-70 factor [bacterium]